MKRRWVIVAITSMALILAGIIARTVRNHRQLARRAALYRIRAEKEDAKSQWALGAMYYYGKGVPKDYVEAARWYLKAAQQGDVNGQSSIASMFFDGKGVPQDRSECARWCRKAAEQGDAPAQYGLGIFYSRGQGVHRTTQRLFAGTANLLIKVMRRPNTPWVLCFTTVTACNRIAFRQTTCFTKLLLTGTRTQSERLSVIGKVSQSIPVQVFFEAFNKSRLISFGHEECQLT